MLACPRCQIALATRTLTTDVEGWEIEVDACEQCGGLWLEVQDFEVDPSAKLLLDAELTALNQPGRKAVDTASPAQCPACQVAMHRYNWNNEGIYLDSCPACKGRWVDGGEIAQIHAQWGVEPISAQEESALVERVRQVGKATAEAWDADEVTFAEWFLSKLRSPLRGRL